jgi:hypothetical protein
VIEGCSRGSLRKYQAHATSHSKLATPNTTKVPRHETTTRSAAISGGGWCGGR